MNVGVVDSLSLGMDELLEELKILKDIFYDVMVFCIVKVEELKFLYDVEVKLVVIVVCGMSYMLGGEYEVFCVVMY